MCPLCSGLFGHLNQLVAKCIQCWCQGVVGHQFPVPVVAGVGQLQGAAHGCHFSIGKTTRVVAQRIQQQTQQRQDMVILVGRVGIDHIEDIERCGGIGKLAVRDIPAPGQFPQTAAVALRLQQHDLYPLFSQPPGQRLGSYRLPFSGSAQNDAVKRIIVLPVQVVDMGGNIIYRDSCVVPCCFLFPANAPHAGKDGWGAAEGIKMPAGLAVGPNMRAAAAW